MTPIHVQMQESTAGGETQKHETEGLLTHVSYSFCSAHTQYTVHPPIFQQLVCPRGIYRKAHWNKSAHVSLIHCVPKGRCRCYSIHSHCCLHSLSCDSGEAPHDLTPLSQLLEYLGSRFPRVGECGLGAHRQALSAVDPESSVTAFLFRWPPLSKGYHLNIAVTCKQRLYLYSPEH